MPAPLALIPKDAAPLVNAAGTTKTVEQCLEALATPLGAVVAGSYTIEERPGNPGNVYFSTPTATLNTLGLPGPPLAVWQGWVRELASRAKEAGKYLWVSIAGFNPVEYRIGSSAALEAGADVIELNLGCPNIWDSGRQKPIVSYSATQTALVLNEVRTVYDPNVPIGVKLSPLLDPIGLEDVDEAVAASGIISFVTAINTVPNSFALVDGHPAITFEHHLAGLSGAAVRWIAMGQVVQHRLAMPNMTIVGVGGIESGQDLLEYLDPTVGASICQVGTAWWRRGPRAVTEILQEYLALR